MPMLPVCSFVAKFSSLIVWVLSCFDRVIFKGHLPISRASEFEKFVDYGLKMRRSDFLKTTAPQWSERLVEHAKDYAQQHGRQFEYRPGQVDKDAWAKEQLRQHDVRDGLVGVLCVQEACPTFTLVPGEGATWLSAACRAPGGRVLLLPRQGPGIDARALAHRGTVHLPGLRQGR